MEITFSIKVHPEDTHPRDHFAYDTEEENESMVNEILAKLEWNEWAWCLVQVVAEYGSLSATTFLGGCSYDSEKAFREDAYFSDMCEELKAELQELAKLSLESSAQFLADYPA